MKQVSKKQNDPATMIAGITSAEINPNGFHVSFHDRKTFRFGKTDAHPYISQDMPTPARATIILLKEKIKSFFRERDNNLEHSPTDNIPPMMVFFLYLTLRALVVCSTCC